MRTGELKRYRAALVAKEDELSILLRRRGLIVVEDSPEGCERNTFAAQRDLAFAALDRHSRLMREVKAALERMGNGRYGLCENCGEAIKPKRLDAIPWARYCMHCQDRIDRGPAPAVAQIMRRLRLAA